MSSPAQPPEPSRPPRSRRPGPSRRPSSRGLLLSTPRPCSRRPSAEDRRSPERVRPRGWRKSEARCRGASQPRGSAGWARGTTPAQPSAGGSGSEPRPAGSARAKSRTGRAAAGPAPGAVPEISYPAELPISQRRDDLLTAIADHQVVVVAGETGSGKSTQLPKLCLELGRGVHGLIGHTQPRRIAARTVAERVAEELGTELGGDGRVHGPVHRPGRRHHAGQADDRRHPAGRDPARPDAARLRHAHHRRGPRAQPQHRLPARLPQAAAAPPARPEGDRHLGHHRPAALRRPLRRRARSIEVSGRTYPVEVRYRPLGEETRTRRRDAEEPRPGQAICDARRRAAPRAGRRRAGVPVRRARDPRHRRRAAARLELPRHRGAPAVRPALGRRAAPDLRQPHRGRRVVLATNVAETSLTVPGHPLRGRRRHGPDLALQPPPQGAAAADRGDLAGLGQPAGRPLRAGLRGICIRLYGEEDFEPGRSSPTRRSCAPTWPRSSCRWPRWAGRRRATFPLPRPARLARRSPTACAADRARRAATTGAQADRQAARHRARAASSPSCRSTRGWPAWSSRPTGDGCVREVLVIAAALSIQDPRERPAEHQQAADQQHARFADPTSDFAGLPQPVGPRPRAAGAAVLEPVPPDVPRPSTCNYLRIREWQDLYGQLRQIVKAHGRPDRRPAGRSRAGPPQPAVGPAVPRRAARTPARRDYLGARNARFAIFPGSALFKKPPRWVMAAELVETSRLWARVNAGIKPEWAEELAAAPGQADATASRTGNATGAR